MVAEGEREAARTLCAGTPGKAAQGESRPQIRQTNPQIRTDSYCSLAFGEAWAAETADSSPTRPPAWAASREPELPEWLVEQLEGRQPARLAADGEQRKAGGPRGGGAYMWKPRPV